LKAKDERISQEHSDKLMNVIKKGMKEPACKMD
jgi:hypothetical protein